MRKISSKHIEVRSCFDDFVEGNSVMQLDFSSDARLKNYSIFKPQINLHALTSSFFFLILRNAVRWQLFCQKGINLIPGCYKTKGRTAGLIYGQPYVSQIFFLITAYKAKWLVSHKIAYTIIQTLSCQNPKAHSVTLQTRHTSKDYYWRPSFHGVTKGWKTVPLSLICP